jgi:hypothetical protein
MGFNPMKHHRPDDPIDWRVNEGHLKGYAEHLIRSAIEEAGEWLTGVEIRNIFKEEMERRYGKEA